MKRYVACLKENVDDLENSKKNHSGENVVNHNVRHTEYTNFVLIEFFVTKSTV